MDDFSGKWLFLRSERKKVDSYNKNLDYTTIDICVIMEIINLLIEYTIKGVCDDI